MSRKYYSIRVHLHDLNLLDYDIRGYKLLINWIHLATLTSYLPAMLLINVSG